LSQFYSRYKKGATWAQAIYLQLPDVEFSSWLHMEKDNALRHLSARLAASAETTMFLETWKSVGGKGWSALTAPNVSQIVAR